MCLKGLARGYLASGLLVAQALVIVALLFWLQRESQANAFMKKWISQNFPGGILLLSDPVVFGISGALLGGAAVLALRLEKGYLAPKGSLTSLRLQKLATLGFQRAAFYGISAIGLVTLGLGAVRSSVSLVLVGFGLLFWGSLAIPRRSSALARAVDDAAISSVTKTLNRLMEDLNFQKEPLYSPIRLESNQVQVSLVIFHGQSSMPHQSIPGESALRQINLLPTPGEGLTRMVEQKLGLDFSGVPLSKVPELLRVAVVDTLRLADDLEYSLAGPIFHFRVFSCAYAALCKEVSEISHIASHIGCPFCSMIASALVKASIKSVSIESSIVSGEGNVIDITLRVFDNEQRVQLAPRLTSG